MESGVQAIFGPSDPVLGAHIQSICEALDVPHIESRVDLEPLSKELSINLHPSQENMNKAYKDLMTFLNWTKVAIIYEEDYGKWNIAKGNMKMKSDYFLYRLILMIFAVGFEIFDQICPISVEHFLDLLKNFFNRLHVLRNW